MNQVVDLNWVTDGTIDRIAQRRQHMEDIRRDAFKRRLKAIADEVEEANAHCRALICSGADVSKELLELETIANGLLLVAGILRLKANEVE